MWQILSGTYYDGDGRRVVSEKAARRAKDAQNDCIYRCLQASKIDRKFKIYEKYCEKIPSKSGCKSVRIGGGALLSATSRSGSWKVDFVRVLISGAEYFVPKHALRRPASQAIISGNFYEPKTHELVKHITEKEEGEIIHAGTFFGDMLPSFAQACGDENLYCFEPVLENYVLARICVSKNNLQNVILFNAALSDTASNLRIQTGNSDGTQKGGAS